MASELQLQTVLNFQKNGAVIQRQLSAQFSVSGTVGLQNIQNIGTSDETLALGDVATNGYLLVHNLDATNLTMAQARFTIRPRAITSKTMTPFQMARHRDLTA